MFTSETLGNAWVHWLPDNLPKGMRRAEDAECIIPDSAGGWFQVPSRAGLYRLRSAGSLNCKAVIGRKNTAEISMSQNVTSKSVACKNKDHTYEVRLSKINLFGYKRNYYTLKCLGRVARWWLVGYFVSLFAFPQIILMTIGHGQVFLPVIRMPSGS